MSYEIYIDQFFLEQFLVGYLLIALAVSLRRERVPRWRMAAGSLVNALVMTGMVIAGVPGGFFLGMPAAGAALYFRQDLRKMMRGMLWLLFVTICFGGALEAVLAVWKLPAVIGAAAAACALRYAGERILAHRMELGETATVSLQWGERTQTLCAMIDTGNRLREPLTGQPVSIMEDNCAGRLLGDGWESRRGFYLIPYHSIGKEKGWLQGVTIDRMRVETAEGMAEFEHPVLAVYRGKVSSGGEYQVILHPLHSAVNRI